MKVILQNITKKFGTTVAVNNFTATLPDGHLICLLGPSGCGKSTILNLLCGIYDATEGKIFFDDEDVTKLPSDKRGIGMVFQNYALYPHMTVLENICFPLEVQKVPKNERKEKAEEIAKLVHVDNLLKRYPSQLSGGQQQRVAIARALIKNPKLLLMDEPLSNLDARLRLEMREEIRRIQQETGVTTIFVTHDQEEAMAISDSILLMKDGILIQEGLCQELYNNPKCKFVSDFLGNPQINTIENLRLENGNVYQNDKLITYLEHLKDKSCSDVTFAVRPESFIIQKSLESSVELQYQSKILRISEMGKEKILSFEYCGKEVRGFISGDEDVQLGTEICITLKKRGVFVFDSTNGERIQ